MRLALLAVLLSGCRWAQVRYVEGAENSRELACVAQANELVCRDYFQALKLDGVQLVPARAPRDMHAL